MENKLFEPIVVSDNMIKFLQDNGIIDKNPITLTTVNKSDIPQMVAPTPHINHKIESKFLVDGEGATHKII